MRVKMLVDLTGHLVDAEGKARDWVSHGHEMDVPEHIGQELVRIGHAIAVAIGVVQPEKVPDAIESPAPSVEPPSPTPPEPTKE